MQQMKQSQPRLDRVLSPFRAFAQKESSGGILLLISTVIALVWANSRWGDSYSAFWHLTPLCSSRGFLTFRVPTRLD